MTPRGSSPARASKTDHDETHHEFMNTSPADIEFDPGATVHAPDLYRPGNIAKPLDGLDQIGAAEIARYRRDGFLAVENAFSAAAVSAAIAGLMDLVMGRHVGFKGILFEAKAKDALPTLNLEQRQDAVRRLAWFVEVEPRLKAFSHDPRLLDVVRNLIGGREPQLFQDMALLKPPHLGREKPWHQDHAYFDYPLGTPVVGVWIALDEATIDNGCMQILPGRHLGGPITHFQRRDWQICDDTVLGTKSTAVPLKPGGLLLFDGLLPHGTPQNNSSLRRRALQFHYAPAGIEKVSRETRLATFGREGKNVTC
jgi:phytanoyl-CoA hydroxylase